MNENTPKEMLEEFVQWRNKNGNEDLEMLLNKDDPFMTVKVDYYENNNSDGERRIRVVTTTERWTGSAKDPITSTTFQYL